MSTSELMASTPERASTAKPFGFWKTWSMTVGVMIGSGVFLLPAVLAPYGGVSFLGWLLTSGGALLLAVVMARLVRHTERPGGPYAFAHDAFGDLVGFLVGWGYWVSVVFGTTAIAVALVGYLTVFVPALESSSALQGLVAAGVIAALALVNTRGVGVGATVQLAMTLLKLVPLAGVIVLGFTQGSVENLPPFNPQGLPLAEALTATALLTMWAFIGIEAAAIPSADIDEPQQTIPGALILGAVTATVVYIASTAAVMLLLSPELVATSTSPFADAAAQVSSFGRPLVAAGAVLATLGALNGMVLLLGQMPMSVALDGLAPRFLARRNSAGAPAAAIVMSVTLSIFLVVLNYREGLVATFGFLIRMSTLGVLGPYAVSALADIKRSWRDASPWMLLGLVALLYCAVAMAGSGLATLGWGLVMLAAGLPVFFFSRRSS